MIEADKLWIDGASYEMLLCRNRFAGLNDLIFQGDSGIYYMEQMSARRRALPEGEAVAISKKIGWSS